MKIISFNFDTKVKIIICVSCFIAMCIILYFAYYLFFTIGRDNYLEEFKIENIIAFEANYEITIKSNLNENKYKVKESTDKENNMYILNIENGLSLELNNDEILIKKDNIDYEYKTNLLNTYNYINLSDVFDIYCKVLDGQIDGVVTKVQNNNVLEYSIKTEGEVFFKIFEIKIVTIDNKIHNVIFLDNELNPCYKLEIKDFRVKK